MSTPPREQGQTGVSLADEDAVRRVLMETLFGLWSTVNNLSRLRPSKNDRYRVTVFGSARTDEAHWVYREVKRMSAALSAMGCDIVTGGGPGLMQAANEGAREANAGERVQSIGIRVELPFEQEVNPFVEQAFELGGLPAHDVQDRPEHLLPQIAGAVERNDGRRRVSPVSGQRPVGIPPEPHPALPCHAGDPAVELILGLGVDHRARAGVLERGCRGQLEVGPLQRRLVARARGDPDAGP